MKKLLLYLLFISSNIFSQNIKQQMEVYSIAKYYNEDGTSTDWNDIDEIRIFFNYSDDENIIKMYMYDNVLFFNNIISPKIKETTNGEKYILYELLNMNDNTKIKLYYYYNNKELGILFIFENNTSLRLSNP